MHIPLDVPLACIEIGGGGVQTVVFHGEVPEIVDGAHQPAGAVLALAVPGIISEGVVVEASNLGWAMTDPVGMFDLEGPAVLVCNDAEAAALGEAALRGQRGLDRLVYVSVGTGVGGAVVTEGTVVRANLFGHHADGYGHRFGDRPCRCERLGCLETVAAGWALPDPLSSEDVAGVGAALARAIDVHPLATEGLVVVGGGIAQRYPDLIAHIRAGLPRRHIEPTEAPAGAKSASAWGLRYALTEQVPA